MDLKIIYATNGSNIVVPLQTTITTTMTTTTKHILEIECLIMYYNILLALSLSPKQQDMGQFRHIYFSLFVNHRKPDFVVNYIMHSIL